jgi:hypothetical protein
MIYTVRSYNFIAKSTAKWSTQLNLQLRCEICYEMVYTVRHCNFATKSVANWLIQSTLQDSLPTLVLMGFKRINGPRWLVEDGTTSWKSFKAGGYLKKKEIHSKDTSLCNIRVLGWLPIFTFFIAVCFFHSIQV